mmetsp:Transcript_15941/g.34622  ORF Transcript_15941/g.34622 Transcript_15941/m.34622 type:complete len:228 (+) Transcript_15941:307-990(+)
MPLLCDKERETVDERLRCSGEADHLRTTWRLWHHRRGLHRHRASAHRVRRGDGVAHGDVRRRNGVTTHRVQRRNRIAGDGCRPLCCTCLDVGERDRRRRLCHRLAPTDAHHIAIQLRLVHLILGRGGVVAVHERDKATVPCSRLLLLGAWPHDLDGLDGTKLLKLAEEDLLGDCWGEVANVQIGRVGVLIVKTRGLLAPVAVITVALATDVSFLLLALQLLHEHGHL